MSSLVGVAEQLKGAVHLSRLGTVRQCCQTFLSSLSVSLLPQAGGLTEHLVFSFYFFMHSLTHTLSMHMHIEHMLI